MENNGRYQQRVKGSLIRTAAPAPATSSVAIRRNTRGVDQSQPGPFSTNPFQTVRAVDFKPLMLR